MGEVRKFSSHKRWTEEEEERLRQLCERKTKSGIAKELGQDEKAALLLDRAHRVEENMERLWNDDFGMYLHRREDTDAFEYHLSPFHFHALFSKKVGKERAERIVREHFYNENEFL